MNYEEEEEPEQEEEPEHEYTSTQTAVEYLQELRMLFGDGRAKEKPAKIEIPYRKAS
jgi:hypothetical protein